MEYLKELKKIYVALDDKFGEDIKIIDIDEISSLTNYFIIVNGKSKSQIEAMTDSLKEHMEEIGVELLQGEGIGSNWALMDYGFAIVHIFDEESRTFYNLEKLWTDGKVVDLDLLK